MWLARLEDSDNGNSYYLQFEDKKSLDFFIQFTRLYKNKMNRDALDYSPAISVQSDAERIDSDEVPEGVVPFLVEDELSPENWMNIFDDNDVLTGIGYLNEIVTGYESQNE